MNITELHVTVLLVQLIFAGLIDAFQGAVSIIVPCTGFVLCPGFLEGYND